MKTTEAAPFNKYAAMHDKSSFTPQNSLFKALYEEVFGKSPD